MIKKIVFCGFGPLAFDSLKVLIAEGHDILCVLTHIDMSIEAVDFLCKEMSIKYYYENPQKNIDFYQKIFNQYDNSLLLSVNYRFILPKEVINCFKIAFNLHGSLLPKYRGRTPHVWAIINGEKYTGVTSHVIIEEVDAGDIIVQKVIDIDSEDTGDSIIKKYRSIYPEVILESFHIIDSHIALIKQNDLEATYFGKRVPDMGYLDPYQTTKRIIDFIRALAPPYPGAYFYDKTGKKIIIERVTIQDYRADEKYTIGFLEEKDGYLYLNCLENKLKIENFNWEKK